MVNPYQSPPEVPKSPFWKRLRRAWSMAVAEYRAGIRRDGFTRRDQVGAWIGMFAGAFICLFVLLWLTVVILLQLGVV